MFSLVNRKYFKFEGEKPKLTWTTKLTKKTLGYYQPLRDRIAISRVLDREEVPYYVVESVMYHELLHRKLGVVIVNGREMAHTKEFRFLEQQYHFYWEAEYWLRNNYNKLFSSLSKNKI